MAQKQYEIKKNVNNLLDVNYLYKRIEFLECAISSLLNDHQLKGIYLSQVNLKMAENQYKKHRIRDRIIEFLDKKNQEKMEQKED
jgi:flagellar basal body-associated protein FliL